MAEPGACDVLDRHSLLEKQKAQVDALNATLKADGVEQAKPFSEQELLAFLRASNFDSAVARSRLLSAHEWRQSAQISEKLHDATWSSQELAMRSVLLYDYLGLDKHGRPILLERVGAWNVSNLLLESQDLGRFKTLHAMAAETLATMKRPEDAKDPRGFVLIMDMAGLGFRHLRPKLASTFGALNEIDESFYPDSLAHVFVVNAPALFTALYAMIKPLVNADTLAKVTLSSSVPDELLEALGADCLPEELRGRRKGIFPYAEDATPSSYPERR
eukprot:TRINITY_DN100676_c0_g1_i1.p1 TRINITY_DN100676_c0_g1~~TRINITY_DN100676_c0_g1_i1.p1  ORF type:complete len:274 (+),score=56.55 TRINITY_DN100676_c0_g1_i1:18-839(+)